MGLFISAVAELYRRSRVKAAAYDREQALREMRQEKEFLADLLEAAEQPFAVGYPDGRIGLVNRAYEELIGYTSAELRSLDWSSALTPPEWRDHEQQKLEELNRTGKPVRYQKEYLRKDGTRVPIELFVNLHRDISGIPEFYYSFVTDISERKAAEDALRKSEMLLRAVLDGSPDPIFLKDRESRLLLANPATFAVIGKPAEACLGKTDEQLYDNPADGRAIMANDRRIMALDRTETVEETVSTTSGPRHYLSTKTPYRDAAGNIIGLIGITRDITERKRVDAAVRESEEKYRNLFENMAEEVHFWQLVRDESGRIKTWRLVDANPTTLKTWGRQSVDEIRGKTTDEIFGPGATDHYMPVVKKIFTEGVPYSFEDYFPNLDKHFRFTSVPLGEYFITTGADVTAVKKTQEALRESEARFRLALRNAPVSVAIEDRNLRYIWAYNQRTARPEEIIGKTDQEIFTPEEAEHIQSLKQRVLRENIELRERMWLERPSGRIFLDIFWEPIHDEAGNVVGVGSATVDLTQFKLAEDALLRSAAELKAVNEELRLSRAATLNLLEDADAARKKAEKTTETLRIEMAERRQAEEALRKVHGELAILLEERTRQLREKEVLLKEVHHRVKNNMQVISSLVALQANELRDAAMREVLQDVTYRVRSMALVHEKLYQSADLARVDFAEYIGGLLGYLWRAHGPAAASVTLKLDLEPVALPVDIAVPCGLILNELAGNTLKHAFQGLPGDEVIVSLRNLQDGRILLGVRDNGKGLPEGFDWRQARSLGLRLVQMLASQLDAKVEVTSGKGVGFEITFPGPPPDDRGLG
jgi:PAS domain S-box-containing protein